MDTAADWAAVSPHALGPDEGMRALASSSITNLSWTQQHQSMSTAGPLFGGRRSWLDYTCETTGYGSLEMAGSLAYRVTIVRPGDTESLRQHHGLVRNGRMKAPWFGRSTDPSSAHVIDHDELVSTRAHARGSWLFSSQDVARLCATDDEVARIAGGSLRRILWDSREHLGSEHITGLLAELRLAAEELAAERTSYRTALTHMVCAGEPGWAGTAARLSSVIQLAQDDLESIRLETRALAGVRTEWDSRASRTRHDVARGRRCPL